MCNWLCKYWVSVSAALQRLYQWFLQTMGKGQSWTKTCHYVGVLCHSITSNLNKQMTFIDIGIVPALEFESSSIKCWPKVKSWQTPSDVLFPIVIKLFIKQSPVWFQLHNNNDFYVLYRRWLHMNDHIRIKFTKLHTIVYCPLLRSFSPGSIHVHYLCSQHSRPHETDNSGVDRREPRVAERTSSGHRPLWN